MKKRIKMLKSFTDNRSRYTKDRFCIVPPELAERFIAELKAEWEFPSKEEVSALEELHIPLEEPLDLEGAE